MDIGKKLMELRRSSGLSQQEVARLISLHTGPITNRAVSKWETGASLPDAAQFVWLCEIYGVTDVVSEFLGIGTGSPFSGLNPEGVRMAGEFISLLKLSDAYAEVEPIREKRSAARVVPLYDLPVSAGTGIFLDSNNFESYEADDIPPEANFAVRISGDSMAPELNDGQIVYVKSCTELEDGDIGIFVYNGDSYCKVLDRSNGLRLVSINPRYTPISIKYAYELRVVGKVVG